MEIWFEVMVYYYWGFCIQYGIVCQIVVNSLINQIWIDVGFSCQGQCFRYCCDVQCDNYLVSQFGDVVCVNIVGMYYGVGYCFYQIVVFIEDCFIVVDYD